jgi:hypothetical protein
LPKTESTHHLNPLLRCLTKNGLRVSTVEIFQFERMTE